MENVKNELFSIQVRKFSITNALGCGMEKKYNESYRGVEDEVDLLKKLRIEVAVNNEYADRVISAIIDGARTSRIGDGKIFVTDLEQCIRIRTGESDREAIG